MLLIIKILRKIYYDNKIKKLNLKFFTILLIFLFSFSKINAMQNIKNPQDNMSNFNNNYLKEDNNFSKNIDLMSIIKKIDFLKK